MRVWVVTVALLAVSTTACHSRADCSGGGNTSASCSARPPVAVRQAQVLNQPSALAAGPSGRLFIADDSRNGIFVRYASGRIAPFAGSGIRGFSGDGQSAGAAELNDPGGMVYDGRTRTLFVADTGNNRIRAIDASGVIRTVAGTGRAGWVASQARALASDLTAPTAVALSPDGRLYITAGLEVLRLDPNGRLTRVAGTRHAAGIAGAGGPATRASTDSANGLAFDGAGNLFLTGSATKGLLVITPKGQMHVLCTTCFYPRGNAGVVTAPDSAVIAMNTQKIYRYTAPTRRTLLINFAGHKPADGVTAVVPTGLAIAANGTIYFGTNGNGGFTNATTLIQFKPPGQLTVVWRRAAKR